MKDVERIKIMGIDVDKVTNEDVLVYFDDCMNEDRCHHIVTLNPEMILEAQHNSAFKELLETADLKFPDGIGLVYASKIVGSPLKERVTGIDFAFEALKHLAQSGRTAYFFGSKPGIAEAAANNMENEIPGLVVSGFRDGYFKPDEEAAIIDDINSSGASFLLLGLGSPKQEFFVQKYKDVLKPRVAVGVGGSFDVWSGSLKRAPSFYIDHNIEWLYRLLQEPSRIKRMSKLPAFLVKVKGYKEA